MESTQRPTAPTESRNQGMTRRWIALLGRRDVPTDGIEDYCSFLGEACACQNIELRQERVRWVEKGWLGALRALWEESANWSEAWVLLQYTTMAWSRRGFPFAILIVQMILRRRGLRCAVVFHEPFRQSGDRWIDIFRGRCQEWVIRRLYLAASKVIFIDPLDKIDWLPSASTKAVFIPIGANIPERSSKNASPPRTGQIRTVAVYCLSDAPNRHREIQDIAHAMRCLAQRGLRARVVFFGRGTAEAKEEVESAFNSATVQVENLGLQSADDVRRILSESDAMLCVRGSLYMRRGSAIAGLACGLPIVGYAGAAEGTPLEEAGVELVPYLDRDALGQALARVLENNELRDRLRQNGSRAYNEHFAWKRIASSLATVLGEARAQP